MAESKKTLEIRKIYNPEQEEKDKIRFVYDRKWAMEQSEMRVNAAKMWDKADKMWEGMREDRNPNDWQSNHYVPITQAAVETLLSETVEQNFKPMILPRGEEDKPKVSIIQHAHDYSWEIADGDLMEHDTLKTAAIRGTAIVQEYYRKDMRIIQNVVIDPDGKETIEEIEMADYDDLYAENVKLEDFFVDEFARGFSGSYQARDCIRRYIMDIEDFKTQFKGKIWDPFENAQYVKPGGDTNYYEWYKPPTGFDMSKRVEILWYWAKSPKDMLRIVANDVLIKDGPNPYKHKQLPFARAVAIKRLHSFYGKGLPEILESTQDEVNVMRRMIIDRNHLDIDKMFTGSSRLTLEDDDLIARPHGFIPGDGENGLKAIEYGDIPRSVELSLKHLEDDATISTGINPRAQSLPTVGTATEAAILKESTLKRIRLMMWLLKYEFLIPLTRLRIANILQFYSQPKLEAIIGEDLTEQQKQEMMQNDSSIVLNDGQLFKKKYREIRLENIAIDFDGQGNPIDTPQDGYSFFELKPEFFMPVARGGYDVKFEAGSNIQLSKPLMQQKNLEAYDRISQVALTVPDSYDIVKLTDKLVLESYDINPSTVKPKQQGQSDTEQRIAMLIDMAGMENNQMMKGIESSPTPYANPAHTRVHLEFMQSDAFQQLPNDSPIIQIFTNHIMGEIAAQEGRALAPNPASQPTPEGGETVPTKISQGIENRPGGMAQPKMKMTDAIPAKQNGSQNPLTA